MSDCSRTVLGSLLSCRMVCVIAVKQICSGIRCEVHVRCIMVEPLRKTKLGNVPWTSISDMTADFPAESGSLCCYPKL